jgi:hypothetical protein
MSSDTQTTLPSHVSSGLLQPATQEEWTQLAVDVENKSAALLEEVHTLSLVSLPSHAVNRLMKRLSIKESGGIVLKNATKFQVTGTAIKQLADDVDAGHELFTASPYHTITDIITGKRPWSERNRIITGRRVGGNTNMQCSLATDIQTRFLQRMIDPQHYCVDWQDLEDITSCEGWANSQIAASAGNIVSLTQVRDSPLSISFHGMVIPWTNATDKRTHACPSTSFVDLAKLKQILISETTPEPDVSVVADALSRLAKPYSVPPTVALHNSTTDEVLALASQVQSLLSDERKDRHLSVQLAQEVPSCQVCGNK